MVFIFIFYSPGGGVISTVYGLHFAEAVGYGDPLIAVLPSFHGTK
jgi:hypothetical protein